MEREINNTVFDLLCAFFPFNVDVIVQFSIVINLNMHFRRIEVNSMCIIFYDYFCNLYFSTDLELCLEIIQRRIKENIVIL